MLRVFDNPNNLLEEVIKWRIHKADGSAVVETYSHTVIETGVTHYYVKIDSVLTDAQIDGGLANPITTKETAAINKRLASLANAQLSTALKTVTADEADTYIENTVTNIATAKVVMKQMAKMIIALRNNAFAEIDV